MAIISSSIILKVATAMSVSCPDAFVKLANSTRSDIDQLKLQEMSNVACETDNPDAFWIIGFAESSFTFDIAVINNGSVKGAYRHEFARSVVKKAALYAPKSNIDVGVLQINMAAHFKNFVKKYPNANLFSPGNQITYVMNEMVPELVKRCGDNWIVCYHSGGNRALQKKYLANVERSRKRLIAVSKKFLRI